VSEELGSQAPEEMTGAARAKRVAYLLKKLRRPLRVCGMVPASGETGGGPFWTRDADGGASIQIVETAQIDVDNEDQKKYVWCCMRDVVYSPAFHRWCVLCVCVCVCVCVE